MVVRRNDPPTHNDDGGKDYFRRIRRLNGDPENEPYVGEMGDFGFRYAEDIVKMQWVRFSHSKKGRSREVAFFDPEYWTSRETDQE